MVHRRASLVARASASLLVAGVLASGAACGTDAVGVDGCQEIEAARCRRAVECGLALDSPRPAADPVAACERFYFDACLHGIQSGKEPTVPQRKACVEAVTTGACDVVRQPERAAGCAFIVPDDQAASSATASAASTTTPPPPVAQPDAGKK